ncbi:HAD family hydrolase [Halobacterium jilantaiense]|uniref:Hydroxymethylpyrimidine pyrophosphatase n=1 Tax=Halobacterium jilantaiense TaxID=355548 RepID=A0A1I0NRY9_9EURY|nr:HAD hydrolase family protein [Halobacterium jilantaiense]SEW04349.1 Hydroxymethylpyrimidine pyrophosphatase [Halobacterium jilantaiense]
MQRHDRLYALYDDFDADALRAHQDFVDLFPPVDSRVALEYWESASEELADRKDEIRAAFPDDPAFAAVAARATRDQAFTALDLLGKYDRAVNVLVLDVDETLRSAGSTDNEIPRATLHLLTEFHEAGIPIVICTGQTLENVKGFLSQGLGNELVHSGDLSVVYEAGTGVFTPGHGPDTKQLLYEDLDESVRSVFDEVRSRVLPSAPDDVRRGCHLQGNEFNVTLKPNYETGSERARGLIDDALVHLLDLLADCLDADAEAVRAYYADADPEIAGVLDSEGVAAGNPDAVSDDLRATLDRVDVAYYEADAAEIASRELNKVVGVEAALDVLDVDDPFALVMGDSKSDLRVMEYVHEHDAGVAAAPEHASGRVLDHVQSTDDLVFDEGAADEVLRTVWALERLA